MSFWQMIGVAAANDAGSVDFNRDIRIILSDRCFACHGPNEEDRKADLRLDTREGALADLGGYAAIKPGDTEASELVYRITLKKDDEDVMPPEKSHKTLEPEEIKLLTRWIAEGAEYSEAWTYVPPKKRAVPKPGKHAWPVNWVDSFVLKNLEEEGLEPSPEADRHTLLRRLYFDLTGLPPSPDEVDDYMDDDREFEEVWMAKIDELLASPHFGERMAVYWLDLVRFADTVGYHGDQDHRITPYRDYIIRAFNNNIPFDQFTREQLAGDLLEESNKWQKVASGYNRLLQTSHEGGVQKKEYDSIYSADRVRNLSAVWMGATVGCAQCHDHKYDPYTAKDFYSMAAFFADIRDDDYNGNSLPTNRPPEMDFYTDEEEEQLAIVLSAIDELIGADTLKRLAVLEAERKKQQTALANLKKKNKKIKDKDKQKDPNKLEDKLASVKKSIIDAVPKRKRKKFDALEAERKRIEGLKRPTMITKAEEPREIRILPRGNWLDESGPIVMPAVPVFMGTVKASKGNRSNRLDLAEWLTDTDNGVGGLTARVCANRIWYLFFGTGISRSLDDFGAQGEPPANPELLDNLAVAFYEGGWDIKAMVRLLVHSRAYRQSSLTSAELRQRDPYNQLVARQSRYRLPAEMIRDQALAVSGLLVDELGGASVKPYQPLDYYRHMNFPKRTYKSHDDSRQWRRGVYVHWQRMFLHPMLKAMDAPSREECTAQRPRSNTPTAALVLLNDPTFIEAARMFAARVIEEGGDSFASRLDKAYSLALSRPPDAEERRVMKNLLKKTRTEYQANPEAVKSLLDTGVAPINNTDALELASWTAVTRALLNLDETITRN